MAHLIQNDVDRKGQILGSTYIKYVRLSWIIYVFVCFNTLLLLEYFKLALCVLGVVQHESLLTLQVFFSGILRLV